MEKEVTLEGLAPERTRYVRDATGNVLSIYTDTTATEQPLYGSSRLGEYRGGVAIGARTLGKRSYELNNHLGNVLSTISDNVGRDGNNVWAKVNSSNDYYPFGLTKPGRSWSESSSYRYGFNGQEKSDEIAPGHYTAEFWEYDSRIGRRWNQDPKPNPSISNYAAFANNPIWFSDAKGDTIIRGRFEMDKKEASVLILGVTTPSKNDER